MEFPKPEWYNMKNLEDGEETLKKQLEELATENRMQDNIIGLHEWDKEVMELDHGIDHLTGADMRKAFEAKLSHAFETMNRKTEKRHGEKAITEVSIIFIDLDNFKQVNDTLGHAQGDEVLKRSALLLRAVLREGDALGRFGGDEFVALLLNADTDGAATVAEKLRSALDNDPELKELKVTGSLGVCSASASGATNSAELIKNADNALYAAKDSGRNRVKVYQGI